MGAAPFWGSSFATAAVPKLAANLVKEIRNVGPTNTI